MVWAFCGNLTVKLSNPDGKVVFQAKIYNKIDPDTADSIITATHLSNCDMQNISTSVNIMTIHCFRRNDIDIYIS